MNRESHSQDIMSTSVGFWLLMNPIRPCRTFWPMWGCHDFARRWRETFSFGGPVATCLMGCAEHRLAKGTTLRKSKVAGWKSTRNWGFKRKGTCTQCIFHRHVWLPEGTGIYRLSIAYRFAKRSMLKYVKYLRHFKARFCNVFFKADPDMVLSARYFLVIYTVPSGSLW